MIREMLGIALATTLFSTPAFSQTDSTESDLRNPRKWALSAEMGMNSLSSLVGPVATFYVQPQVAVDLGLGLSSVGLRPGLRARYNFSRDKIAYFGGMGIKYGMGSGGEEVELEDPETKEKFKVELDPSTFLDFQLGVEFMANNGFLVIGSAGWSQLLGDRIYQVSPGYTPSEKTTKLYDTVFGSGILFSLSLGKAF